MKIDTMTANDLRDVMRDRAALGTFITSGAPCITEIAALSGLDFIILTKSTVLYMALKIT